MNFISFGKKYALPLWKWYLAGTVFLIVTNIITLEIPQFAKKIVNSMDSLNDPEQLKTIALAIVALGFGQMISRSLSRILIFWPGRKLEASSKIDIFSHAMKLPQDFYEKYGLGDLISRLSNDIGQLRVFYAFAALQILNLIFLMSFTLVKMFSINSKLAGLCLIPISMMIVLGKFLMPYLTKYSRENQKAIGELTNKITEAFTNIHVIKANAREDIFIERANPSNEKVYKSNVRLVCFRVLFFPLLTTLTATSQILVLYIGGQEVLAGRLTVGDILAFNVYLTYLAFPITSLGFVMSIYQRSKTALERISPIAEAEEEHAEKGLKDISTENILDIRNLSFSFDDIEVLKDISLSVKKGEHIGLVGEVGSGKSVLFDIITRIYKPKAGEVFFEGEDILSMSPSKLREECAYALQESHMFSDSIENNLKLGLSDETEKTSLEKATKEASVYGEILRFGEQWDTEIGEKGMRLSGGQKQRLALSRIFLRKAKLLLLDDVLSAVDTRTEKHLINSIQSRNCSMIISSHRNSVLRKCDRVIYLSAGKIVDQGSFTELQSKYPHLTEGAQ